MALFLYREDANMKLSKMKFIYSVLPCVELIEVDKVEACCSGITSDCMIRRTKEKLPGILKGYNMPLIGDVTSIDGSVKIIRTTSSQYTRKANSSDFTYNTAKYYWFMDDHLYFPNIEWDAVRIEAVIDGESLDCGEVDPCIQAHDIGFSAPDHLFSTVQAEVIKDIAFLIQVPKDPVPDKQSQS